MNRYLVVLVQTPIRRLMLVLLQRRRELRIEWGRLQAEAYGLKAEVENAPPFPYPPLPPELGDKLHRLRELIRQGVFDNTLIDRPGIDAQRDEDLREVAARRWKAGAVDPKLRALAVKVNSKTATARERRRFNEWMQQPDAHGESLAVLLESEADVERLGGHMRSIAQEQEIQGLRPLRRSKQDAARALNEQKRLEAESVYKRLLGYYAEIHVSDPYATEGAKVDQALEKHRQESAKAGKRDRIRTSPATFYRAKQAFPDYLRQCIADENRMREGE